MEPANFTTLQGPFDWAFSQFETNIFGSVAFVVLFSILIVFVLVQIMKGNKFVLGSFIGILLIAFGRFGYTYFGWIATLGAIIFGLLFYFLIIRIFDQY